MSSAPSGLQKQTGSTIYFQIFVLIDVLFSDIFGDQIVGHVH
jgi:hypothetical protein